MFMNTTRCDYIKVDGYPSGSIMVERPHTMAQTDPGRSARLSDDLRPLVDRLMKERPRWRFLAHHAYGGGNPIIIKELHVYEEDEKLGAIGVERHWRDASLRYNYTSARGVAGRGRYSSKLPVATKGILKMFFLRTPLERLSDAASKINGVTATTVGKVNNRVYTTRRMIEGAAYARALLDWPTMKAVLGDAVADIDLPSLAQEQADITVLSNAVSDGNGRIVRVNREDNYLVGRRAEENYAMVIHDDNTMPANLKGNLGILKMVEDGSAIPGVGVRVDAQTFFVLIEEEAGDGNAE